MKASIVFLTNPGVAKVTQCSHGKQDLYLKDLQLQSLELLYGCLGAKMSSSLSAAKPLVAGSEEDAQRPSLTRVRFPTPACDILF